ncbi:putative pterin-4-alpha-carbinolamine dehydratase, partial [Aspergillus hancockii]
TRTTLIPILRAALPMYVALKPHLPHSTCLLAQASKTKGTKQVSLTWPGRRPYPPQRDDGRIIILDTVIATGDTVVALCEAIWAMGAREAGRKVVVMCVYGAPEALERVRKCEGVECVVVGFVAEGCDEHGYLVPATHGDVGDKIYGVAWQGEVVVAKGEDEKVVLDG